MLYSLKQQIITLVIKMARKLAGLKFDIDLQTLGFNVELTGP